MVICLEEYKFHIQDPNEPKGFAEYKGKMEVSYDGEFLGVDTWEVPVDQEFYDSPIQQITLVGENQANLLAGAILALLESYNQPNLLNDEDVQKDYQQMAQKAKESNAEEAIKQPEE